MTINRITDAIPVKELCHPDDAMSPETAELLDEAIAVMRKELGEAVNDLYLFQASWLRDRQEFVIRLYVTWTSRFRFQSWDHDCVLDSLKAAAVVIRLDVERCKREGLMA